MSRIGAIAAAPFLGGQFVSLYRGATRVPTVPGRLVITAAAWNGSTTVVSFSAGEGNGGSNVLSGPSGRKFYIDGVLTAPDSEFLSTASFNQDRRGQSVRMSSVNAIGEGPLSAPVTVT